MKTMNEVKFSNVVSAGGNVFRTVANVAGKEYRLEMDRDKTWLHIIADDSRCETCVIDADGDVIADGGEYVTEDWSQQDWSDLTEAVGAK